jgi:hypothetical protein
LPGDSLRSIADRVYGNPDLWFVLAEANGLRGGELIREGTRITVPNSVKSGRLTAETNVVYDQGDIIGSTLPNLQSEASQSSGGSDPKCAVWVVIVIVIVISIVIVVATLGAGIAIAGAFAAAGLSGAALIAATAVTTAVVAGALAFAGSLATQGVLIAAGYQQEIDWKQVAADTLVGAASGFAAGAASGVAAAAKIAQLSRTIVAITAVSAALVSASAEAGSQVITAGKITSWTAIAGAGVLAAAAVVGGNAAGNAQRARSTAQAAAQSAKAAAVLGTSADDAAAGISKAQSTLRTVLRVSSITSLALTGAGLTEKAIRGEEISTVDWVAAGLSVAFTAIWWAGGTSQLSASQTRDTAAARSAVRQASGVIETTKAAFGAAGAYYRNLTVAVGFTAGRFDILRFNAVTEPGKRLINTAFAASGTESSDDAEQSPANGPIELPENLESQYSRVGKDRPFLIPDLNEVAEPVEPRARPEVPLDAEALLEQLGLKPNPAG